MKNSGYKAFDHALASQGGLITRGNVISNTMFGFHVRARTETSCNGYSFSYGKLQETDLTPMSDKSRSYGAECAAVYRYIKSSKHFEENSGWVSIIRHVRSSDRTVVVHGVLVTDYQHKLLKRFDRLELQYSERRQFQRSAQVLDSVMEILCPAPVQIVEA